MSNVPCILIVTAAHAVDMSAVFEAQGRGAGTFTLGRRLVASGTTSPVVARLTQDMSATATLEAAWRAMAADNVGTTGTDAIVRTVGRMGKPHTAPTTYVGTSVAAT